MSCFHCGAAEAPITDRLCVACAADTLMGRVKFASHRFLLPGEQAEFIEMRGSRTDDNWFAIAAAGHGPIPATGFGLFRTKIRLYRDARRYLDVGETILEAYDGAVPGDRDKQQRLVFGAQVQEDITFTRPMYLEFPPSLCACPEEGRLELPGTEPQAAACKTCGRVWADLAGHPPEVERPAIPRSNVPCRCDEVEVLEPIPAIRRKPIRPLLHQALTDNGDASVAPARLRCLRCHQVWTEDAWLARFSLYPDLHVHDRQLIRAALYSAGYHGGVQASAMERYLLRVQEHRWRARLRKGALKELGKAEVESIDAEFASIFKTLEQRSKPDLESTDPVALFDTRAAHDHVKGCLDLMEDLFKAGCYAARASRREALDAWLVQRGGKPFFDAPDVKLHADAPEPIPEPALAELADYMRPVVAVLLEGSDPNTWGARSVVHTVGEAHGPQLQEALTAPHLITLSAEGAQILGRLCELISPFEDSYTAVGPPDLSDLPAAVNAPPGPRSWSPRDMTPGDVMVHILSPGEILRVGDAWRDGEVLRPVQATVGKVVPGYAVLEAQAKDQVNAVAGTSLFCRPFHPTSALEPPDTFRELSAYNALLEGTPPAPLDVVATAPAPRIATTTELETTLRQLYAAVGLEVETFTIDEEHKIARLQLKGGNVIAVGLPPGLVL